MLGQDSAVLTARGGPRGGDTSGEPGRPSSAPDPHGRDHPLSPETSAAIGSDQELQITVLS